MLGNFVNTIRSRLTARVGDEIYQPPETSPRSRNIFLKLLNKSYAIVSQNQDDAYCNDNLFMLPRVYSQKTENFNGLWSPVSLKAPEKSLDELENVVEKFVRCISVENYCGVTNVKRDVKGLNWDFKGIQRWSILMWTQFNGPALETCLNY